MFGFGYGELVVMALVCLLLFGKRLPGAMKSVGKGLNIFSKTIREETDKITYRTDNLS